MIIRARLGVTLLHPVRLARMAFRGEFSVMMLWDVAYLLIVSALLLAWAGKTVRRRLTN